MTSAIASGGPSSGPGVQTSRSTESGVAASASACSARAANPAASTGGRPIRAAEVPSRPRCSVSRNGPSARTRATSRMRPVHAGARRRPRGAPARRDRRCPRPPTATASGLIAPPPPAAARRSPRAAAPPSTSDSSTSADGSESQTTPPPTQRCIEPALDRERADRERELEVAVAPDASERAHRGAAADRLELRDQVDRRDLRRTGDRAARERRREQLREPDVLAQRSLDRRDEVLDAREPPRRHQLGPADAARLADAREVVPLEVDDHHVLGRVLRATPAQLGRAAGRSRALDRTGPDRRPRRSRKSSGDADTIAHPSPANGSRLYGFSAREAGGERARVARERRGEVLDEVDLVDVAARDRLAHLVDRCAGTRPPSRCAPRSRSREPPLARSTT